MKKRIIRLTEGDLHRIVKKSVNRILRESYEDDEIIAENNPLRYEVVVPNPNQELVSATLKTGFINDLKGKFRVY